MKMPISKKDTYIEKNETLWEEKMMTMSKRKTAREKTYTLKRVIASSPKHQRVDLASFFL